MEIDGSEEEVGLGLGEYRWADLLGGPIGQLGFSLLDLQKIERKNREKREGQRKNWHGVNFLRLRKMSLIQENRNGHGCKVQIQKHLNFTQMGLKQDLVFEVSKNVEIFGGTSAKGKRDAGKVLKSNLKQKRHGEFLQVCLWVIPNYWNIILQLPNIGVYVVKRITT